jgi:hypothetical protein
LLKNLPLAAITRSPKRSHYVTSRTHWYSPSQNSDLSRQKNPLFHLTPILILMTLLRFAYNHKTRIIKLTFGLCCSFLNLLFNSQNNLIAGSFGCSKERKEKECSEASNSTCYQGSNVINSRKITELLNIWNWNSRKFNGVWTRWRNQPVKSNSCY